MTLNSNGRCEHCGAIVRNGCYPDGRRRKMTIERLTELHDEVCPGLHRASNNGRRRG